MDLPSPEPFLIANHLRGPSYVSLEAALFYWNLIPERIYEISSATIKTSKTYKTQILLACQMCLLVVLEPRLTPIDSTYIHLTKEECSKATSIFQLGVLIGNLIIGSVTDTFG